MGFLSGHHGSWTGTNRFRLMPTDEPHSAAATAVVSVAAGENVAVIAYTWSHPKDGAQEGLLMIAPDEEPDRLVALWGDSWHQAPAGRALAGAIADGVGTVGASYGGDWQWTITVDPSDPALLRVRMDNVVPQSAATEEHSAGAYWAMATELRREG